VRGEKGGAKERISGSERGDEKKRTKMAGGGEKLEQREKKERKNTVIITGIGRIRENTESGVEEGLEGEVGEWFIWDEREEKLKKLFRRRREEEKRNRREKV
jgi:hypothetical protein